MSCIRSFRDLDVWNAAMALAERCYRITPSFPPEERLGLSAELDTQIELARRLGYVAKEEAQYTATDVASVGRQLSGLIRALEPSRRSSGTMHQAPDPTP